MEKHTHCYIRIKLGKNKRIEYKCSIPGCVHHLRYPELVVGRMTQCNRCNDEFIFEKRHLELAKPHCDKCTNSRNKDREKLLELLGAK